MTSKGLAASELPDKLSVKASTNPATAGAGSTVTIAVAVTNRGPEAAGPMSVCGSDRSHGGLPREAA
jgi:hypothetical protein